MNATNEASGAHLVLAHPERRAQRALARILGATLRPVRVVADREALARAVDPQTIAVVDHGIARAHLDLCTLPARAWIAVPGEGESAADAETMAALLAAGWTHVVAHAMPILAEELLTTVQKLLRADPFGLEKYMAWGAEVRSYIIDDLGARGAAVDALARDVIGVGLPERVGSLISVVADELIANALFAAPVDAPGVRIRAGSARDEARALSDREIVTVRWATDARYLAVEVRDRFGSFEPQSACAQLARRGYTGDGGMGLPLAYACSNQFVIGVAPGRMTEVIALVDVRYKATELPRVASFHAFRSEGQ